MAKTTRSDLIKQVAETTSLNQSQVKEAFQALSDKVNEHVSNGRDVHFEGIFNIQVGKREARMGRNPRTGEPLSIPAKAKVNIKYAKRLKASVESIDIATLS